jgi:hypothetical protein
MNDCATRACNDAPFPPLQAPPRPHPARPERDNARGGGPRCRRTPSPSRQCPPAPLSLSLSPPPPFVCVQPSSVFSTVFRTRRLYSLGLSRSIFPASMFAGLSQLGSESMLMTDTSTCSTPRMGRHRSSAVSCARGREDRKGGRGGNDGRTDRRHEWGEGEARKTGRLCWWAPVSVSVSAPGD